MNIKYTLSEQVTDYLLNNEGKAKISSLEISKGDVFLSLLGKKTHGNQYIPDAINKGAKYIITDRKLEDNYIFDNILIVDDVLTFLLSSFSTLVNRVSSCSTQVLKKTSFIFLVSLYV